jgi:hypothetical protein
MTTHAFDLLCTTTRDVAAELGLSFDAVKSYRAGRRAPSPATARSLAALMRRRAKALTLLAARLEQEVKGGAP